MIYILKDNSICPFSKYVITNSYGTMFLSANWYKEAKIKVKENLQALAIANNAKLKSRIILNGNTINDIITFDFDDFNGWHHVNGKTYKDLESALIA